MRRKGSHSQRVHAAPIGLTHSPPAAHVCSRPGVGGERRGGFRPPRARAGFVCVWAWGPNRIPPSSSTVRGSIVLMLVEGRHMYVFGGQCTVDARILILRSIVIHILVGRRNSQTEYFNQP